MTYPSQTPSFQEGDFGRPIRVRVTEDGAPVDVSSATTRQIILRRLAPSGTTTRTLTATFTTDGTDGLLQATPDANTILTPTGPWEIQARVAGTGFDYRTEWGAFQVKGN